MFTFPCFLFPFNNLMLEVYGSSRHYASPHHTPLLTDMQVVAVTVGVSPTLEDMKSSFDMLELWRTRKDAEFVPPVPE